MKTIRIIHLMLLALSAPALAVNPPGILNHQGRIAVNGANYDGTGYFKFALVNGGTNTSVQATATATIEAEAVTTIALTNGGAGYVTAPAVTFSGGGGSGAAATATLSNGTVTALTLTSGGNNYMTDPEVTIAPPPANIQHLSYWSNDTTSNGGSQPASAVPVLIAKGHYAVLLGDTTLPNMTTAIPAAVFADHETVALRVWFSTASGGPFELLSPDRRIASTGYALAAQRAETVAPGGVTSTMLADGAVTAAKIANDAVTGLALAPGAVTSGAIADGSVTSYDLALGATGLVRKPVLLSQTGGGVALRVPTDTPNTPVRVNLVAAMNIVSDTTWKCSETVPADWQNPGFDDSSWVAAVSLPFVWASNYNPGVTVGYPYPASGYIPDTLGQHIWHASLAETAYFRKSFTVGGLPESSQATVRVDDAYDFYLNGFLVGFKHERSPSGAQIYDITSRLRVGENVFAIKGWDLSGGMAFLFDADVNQLLYPANAANVFVSNGKAYCTNANANEGTLSILDVSNPALPLTLADLASPHPTFALAGARDVFVSGTTAYLAAASDSALNIMDVSNPASPHLLALLRDGVGGFDKLAGAWSVFVSGNTAYITATGDDALTIIDVSNPSAPVKLSEIVDGVGSFTKLGGARDVYVVGTTAYVTAAGDNALTIIDVSNPAAPVLLAEIVDEVGSFTKLAGAREVFVLDGKAYVTADADDALTIIDVSNPSSPALLAEVVDGVGGFNRLDGAAGVHVSGSIAMVTSEGDNAVSMIDVSKPAAPVLLEETVDENGGFTKLGGADGIFIYGTLALVASNQDDALTILDLASPAAEYAGTVTNAALATDSVTSDKILDGSVGKDDVGDNAIDSNKIVDSSIAKDDLGDGVVDSIKIADKSITDADFADSAVTTSALADDSVTTSKILDGTLLSGDLADGAVTGDKIADGVIGGNKLAAGGVATDALASGAVTSVKLASASVTLDKLALGGSIGQILFNTGTATEWRNPVAVLGDESPTNEIQQLSIAGGVLSLSNGGGSVSVGDADADPTNELQTLSLVGDSLSLAPGSGSPVDLGQYFRNDGSQAFGGALNLNNYGILNVQSITPPPDPVVPAGPGTLNLLGNLSVPAIVGDTSLPVKIIGGLDLNDNSIIKLSSIAPPTAVVPPYGPGTLTVGGNLNMDGHNIIEVQSLKPAGATNSLKIDGDLDLNGKMIHNIEKLGIGIGAAQGALHVSTNETVTPISLLEHSVSAGASALHSIARLRAVTSSTMNNGFGAGLIFETKDVSSGTIAIAQIGAVRDGANQNGALHLQTGNTTDGLTTKMTVRSGGNIEMLRDLYVGTVSASGDDTIYFDSAGAEYLRWQESQSRFLFSDDVWGTTFNPTSDRNLKEQFEKIDPLEVLDRVAAMPITTWKFKDDAPALRHIGPMAQDFHQAFGLGPDDRHISTTDADGVAFAAIQALKQSLDDKERQIQQLEKRLQRLERSNQETP